MTADLALATCPHHPAAPAAAERGWQVVDAGRLVLQTVTAAGGRPEVHLHHGPLEVVFDEPELQDFARALARFPRFDEGQARGWAPLCEPERLRHLLGELADAGLLEPLASQDDAADDSAFGDRPDPLPPAPASAPRDWREGPALMRELAGRALELGHLEQVLPVFRVAHMAIDCEGRQVGEANVFPPAARLPVPTRWRRCVYRGSRHQDERPMNVSALKSMRAHWPQMLGLLARVREAYLRRCPDAATGWTVGHVERLAMGVLGLATWPLVREGEAARPPGTPLHPVLSSLFRVADGLRMTMHQMLFIPAEATLGEVAASPDAPITTAEVLAYAERNASFHSEHGVCAGPQRMVEEFLAVLVDGQRPPEAALDAELQAELARLDDALDYAFHGLRVYAAVFCWWPMAVRGHARITALAEAAAAERPDSVDLRALAAGLRVQARRHETQGYLGREAWRTARDRVYDDMDARCARALGEPAVAALTTRRSPVPGISPRILRAVLGEILERRFGPVTPGSALVALRDALAHLLLEAQGLLAEADRLQAALNRHVGRAAPRQPLAAVDIDLHHRLHGPLDRRVPFLIDELERLFGLQITLDASRLAVRDALRAGSPLFREAHAP